MKPVNAVKPAEWFRKPMRIAALQCNFEDQSNLQVLDKWKDMGFNVEQLFHPMAEDYTALFDEKKHGSTLRAYLRKAARLNIRIILYLNVHILPSSAGNRKNEWAQRDGKGGFPRMYDTYYTCCVNSSWRNHFFGVLESLKGLDIGGVFLDGPYMAGDGCRCPACRRQFNKLTGTKMTGSTDLADFARISLDTFLRESYSRFKSIHPGGIFYQNLGLMHLTSSRMRLPDALDYNDIVGTEGGFMFYGPPKRAYLFRPGLSARVSEAVAPGKPRVIFMAADQKPWSWLPHTPAETELCIASSAANGSSVWYGLHGSTGLLKTPAGRAAAEMFRFMAAHEDVYTDATSLARVAILFSLATEHSYRATQGESDLYGRRAAAANLEQGDFMEAFQGTADLLARSGIPFDVVTDLDLSQAAVSRYSCLILPTSACLSSKTVLAIKQYVRQGGKLITFNDSGFYDENGRMLKPPALAEVLGINASCTSMPLKNFNYFKATTRHPLFKGLEETVLFPAPSTGLAVTTRPGAKVLARFLKPLPGRYVPLTQPEHPAIISNRYGKGTSLYFAGTFGEMATSYNPPEYRRMLQNALSSASDAPVTLQGDACNMEVVARQQNHKGNTRLIVHLVNHSGVLPRPFERITPQSGLSLLIRTQGTNGLAKRLTGATARAAGKRCKTGHHPDGLLITLPTIGTYEIIVVE